MASSKKNIIRGGELFPVIFEEKKLFGLIKTIETTKGESMGQYLQIDTELPVEKVILNGEIINIKNTNK